MNSSPQSKEMSSNVVSSRTSRTAASIGSSPRSTSPLGKSQFRYARNRRYLSFRSTKLTTTTPEDNLVGGATEDMDMLVYLPALPLYSRAPGAAAPRGRARA